MIWTTVKFGKYSGKTLPQIVLTDPNWFFWAADILYGPLATEAETLKRRARGIRIPKPKPKKWEIEYRFDHDLRFLGFGFVKANCTFHAAYSNYLPHLDLACVRRGHRVSIPSRARSATGTPDAGLTSGSPCQAPSFLVSPLALKQAIRAWRLAADKIATRARGSPGSREEERVEISSFRSLDSPALS
jgi:hypothetical protein